MKLHVIAAGPVRTNAYLLTAHERGEALLIDAPEEIWSHVEPVLAAERCQLRELWITHGHWDHMQGGAEVVRATAARVSAHAADRMLFETPEMMSAFMFEPTTIERLKIDRWIAQGDALEALGLRAEVRHVPGHCPGNVLFYFPAVMAAFVGDTLFAGNIGRTDLPGGDPDELDRSIRTQIYTLPEETTVFPGHGPDTTVGAEMTTNPYVDG